MEESAQLMVAKKIIKELMSNDTLPALNENVAAICSISNDNETSSADLAAVIMRDCGLVSNLLTIANSSIYSPKYPIKTVSSAVIFLGFDKVKSLALGLSIFEGTIKNFRSKNLAEMYASSYFSASFAMALSESVNSVEPEEVFVGALLSQLPKMALANSFPEKYKKLQDLVKVSNVSENQAYEYIFKTSYSTLCLALSQSYNLPQNITMAISSNTFGKTSQIIHEASLIAKMIFTGPCDKKTLNKTESKIKDLISNPDFSILDFIESTCERDPNMKKYFNMDKNDIEIMVKLIEWGKVNTTIASQILFNDKFEEEGELPENLIGKYLTEMMLIRRKEKDLNKIIMVAQEALFKCIPNSYIFLSFIDPKLKRLVGKFYAGSQSKIKASDFHVQLSATNSPVLKTIKEQTPYYWNKELSPKLNISPLIENTLQLGYAIIQPIVVNSKTIGIYFIARKKTEKPFSENEEIWIEEITEHINKSFKMIRSGSNE